MRGREIGRARQTFQSGVLLDPNFHLSAQKFPPFGAAAVSSFCLSIISHLHLVSPYLLLTVAFLLLTVGSTSAMMMQDPVHTDGVRMDCLELLTENAVCVLHLPCGMVKILF